MMEPPPPTTAFHPRGFDALYGLELLQVGSDEVRGQVTVRDDVRQPFGLVHGGLYASIAESLASIGTAVEVLKQGLTAMGMSNNTTFLRSITAGTVHTTAKPLHRGRTTWVWDVEITDDEHRLCATSRVTIAVRAPR
jgi:1,4-dihydroxy-2-naphthoyl-CoA hydrolase